MDLRLKGKTALILGGGGGLGHATANALAAEGAQIAVADINPDAAAAAQADIEKHGARAFSLAWDLAELAVIDSQVSAIERNLGAIDILINITGGPPPTPVAGQAPDLWTKHFQSMILSVIAIADRVLPGMRARKWGRIVTSTSSGVVAPIPNLGLSNTLRLSLLGWSKTLAREVGSLGITSNIVVPGRIATGRTKFLDEAKAKRESRSVDDVSAESAAAIPTGRYGRPEEFGDLVAFLASERAAYVNGSVIRIDGGLIPSV